MKYTCSHTLRLSSVTLLTTYKYLHVIRYVHRLQKRSKAFYNICNIIFLVSQLSSIITDFRISFRGFKRVPRKCGKYNIVYYTGKGRLRCGVHHRGPPCIRGHSRTERVTGCYSKEKTST